MEETISTGDGPYRPMGDNLEARVAWLLDLKAKGYSIEEITDIMGRTVAPPKEPMPAKGSAPAFTPLRTGRQPAPARAFRPQGPAAPPPPPRAEKAEPPAPRIFVDHGRGLDAPAGPAKTPTIARIETPKPRPEPLMERIPEKTGEIAAKRGAKPGSERGKAKGPENLARLLALIGGRGGKCELAEWPGTATRIAVQCAEGHRWNPTPGNLIHQNSWCPRCAKAKAAAARKASSSPEAGAWRLAKLLALIGGRGGKCDLAEWPGNNARIPVECAEGHRWNPTAANLIHQNSWCPKCAKAKAAAAKSLEANKPPAGIPSEPKTAESEERLAKLLALIGSRGGKCDLAEWPGNKARIPVECAAGHRWNPTPANLIHRDSWCPKCGEDQKKKDAMGFDARKSAQERRESPAALIRRLDRLEAEAREIRAALAILLPPQDKPGVCPRCGSEHTVANGQADGTPRRKCNSCGKTHNAKTGTPEARLRMPEKRDAHAECVAEGLTLAETAERIGVSLETAHRWRHRLAPKAGDGAAAAKARSMLAEGMTQAAVAKALGTSQSMVSKWHREGGA